MHKWSRAAAVVMVLSLALGGLLAIPKAARADDSPTIGKPIIIKDPKPQPKGSVLAAARLPGN